MANINALIPMIALRLIMQTTGPTSPPTTEPAVDMYSKEVDGGRLVLVREDRIIEKGDGEVRIPVARTYFYVLLFHPKGQQREQVLWQIAAPPFTGFFTPDLEPQILDVVVEANRTVLVFNMYGQCWARVVNGISDGVPITVPSRPIASKRYNGDLGSAKISARVTGSLAEGTLRIVTVDENGISSTFKLTRNDQDGEWTMTEP